MHLENIVFDATDPRRLGRSWEESLGTEVLSDEPDGYETRLHLPGDWFLDLCFQRVPEPPAGPERLHLDVSGEPTPGTGPIAAVRLESSNPERDGALWLWLTGWVRNDGTVPVSMRHPTDTGPVLEICPEESPKTGCKNGVHLDLRLDPGDDLEVLSREIVDRGGRAHEHEWGDLPWRVFEDGSGNEFCLLPG